MNPVILVRIALIPLSLASCSKGRPSVQLVEMYSPGDLVIQGRFDMDPRDHGRPVVLIAAALGVPVEVFREAFLGVSPSRFGPPTSDRARSNKAALMRILASYEISNERLDEVSDRYRYHRGGGEIWQHQPAMIVATLQDGEVVGFDMIEPGCGYRSPPKLSVFGHEDFAVEVSIGFSSDFAKNGRISDFKILEDSSADDAGDLAAF